MLNRFNQGGIYLPFEVYGDDAQQSTQLVGLVDTGFNGYLTLPQAEATTLGLQIKGSQEYVLANGSVSKHIICWGTIRCIDEELGIPIDVQENGPILLGMQLFTKLKKCLTIDFNEETFEFTSAALVKSCVLARLAASF
jgi:predicted aspartyl protease